MAKFSMHAAHLMFFPTIIIIIIGVTSEQIEVFVNDSASVRCYANASTDIQWHFNSYTNYVYAGRRFFIPYRGRFRSEYDEAANAYNLIIPRVKLEDSGRYYCSEEDSGYQISFTQLTVLYVNPVCNSNMHPDGFVGPNMCNLTQENMVFTCDVSFNGRPPYLIWRSSKDSQAICGSACEVKQDRITCNLTLKSDQLYDGSFFSCDAITADGTRFSCKTEAIKVQYFFADHGNEDEKVQKRANCVVKSNRNIKYKWTLKQNNQHTFLSANQTILIQEPGIHQCEVEYSIRNATCSAIVLSLNISGNSADFVAIKDHGNQLLVIILPLLTAIIIVLIAGFIIFVRKKKRAKQKKDEAKKKEAHFKEQVAEAKKKEAYFKEQVALLLKYSASDNTNITDVRPDKMSTSSICPPLFAGGSLSYEIDRESLLHRLPEDMFLTILHYVPPMDLIHNGRLVCKYWLALIDNSSLWILLCQLDGVQYPQETDLVSDFRSFYFKRPFRRNLVKNWNAAEGLTHWNITANGGNGFAVEPNNCHYSFPVSSINVSGCSNCWVTSHGWCKKYQTIDLLAEGFTREILDMLKPTIEFSEWTAARFDCASQYSVEVTLESSAGEILDIFNSERRVDKWQNFSWIKIAHMFCNYPTGVRFVKVEHGGKDLQSWAGHYGPKITATCVMISLKN